MEGDSDGEAETDNVGEAEVDSDGLAEGALVCNLNFVVFAEPKEEFAGRVGLGTLGRLKEAEGS